MTPVPGLEDESDVAVCIFAIIVLFAREKELQKKSRIKIKQRRLEEQFKKSNKQR